MHLQNRSSVLPTVVVYDGNLRCELYLDSDNAVNIVNANTFLNYLQDKFEDIKGPVTLMQGVIKEKAQTVGDLEILLSLLHCTFGENFVFMQASYYFLGYTKYKVLHLPKKSISRF